MKNGMTKKEMEKEHGRAIARAMEEEKVEHQKNMAKAAKRRETILGRAAEKALSGGVQHRRP